MTLVTIKFPDVPQGLQLNAAETGRLQSRLAFDGIAVIISIILGHVGFVYVSVSEARRYMRSQTEKLTLQSEMAAAREVQRVMVPVDLPAITAIPSKASIDPLPKWAAISFRSSL